jgi:hypothetical protein
MRNVYDHLIQDFNNPATIKDTGRTYADEKDIIVKYEAALYEGELDRKKEISG